jgi:hypothetical protein
VCKEADGDRRKVFDERLSYSKRRTLNMRGKMNGCGVRRGCCQAGLKPSGSLISHSSLNRVGPRHDALFHGE